MDSTAPGRQLVRLTDDECFRLLRTAVVGRIVFDDARGPVALPVNYAMDGLDIVFRTSAMSNVRASVYMPAAFEVDAIDVQRRDGWSVLASGRVLEVDDPAEIARLEALGVAPWAGGERTNHLRLTVQRVTGRRLVADDSLTA
jgi:nitroimidazol reductase NimA-like FMN-containing flavoprotein (pyridoxamine 5'-phosphate oxidase superfamily)